MPSNTLKFDVIVVGGGPAGLSAAAVSAKEGLSVAVIEKDPNIAHTIRTSGVTWLSEITSLGLPEEFYHPLRRYGVYSAGQEHVFETPEAEACSLDVRKLYQYLAIQAATQGAEIFLQTLVTDASYEQGKALIKISASAPTGSVDFLGGLVIDASGFSTIIGRRLGFVNEWKRFGIGAEYEVYAENVDVETWALMVGSMFSPAGYAWLFPVGKNRVRIGVGIGEPESNIDPLTQLRYLIEKRPGPLKALGRICPLEVHSGVVPNQGPRQSTVADRVLLVGDSAGQLNPLLLEGIRFAIKFGRFAGEAAKHFIDKTCRGNPLLSDYEAKWRKEIWSNFQLGMDVQKKWLKLSDEQWNKEISILEALSAKEVLSLLQCQFSTRSLMSQVAHHPALLKSQSFSTILRGKTKTHS